MQSSEQIVQSLRELVGRLKLRYPIRSMALFGSVTREDFGPESDVDILVEFDGSVGSRFIDLALELEAHLGRKVDLVSRKGIREKYFQEIAQDLHYV
jgi:predicted nucleotidyltransferase